MQVCQSQSLTAEVMFLCWTMQQGYLNYKSDRLTKYHTIIIPQRGYIAFTVSVCTCMYVCMLVSTYVCMYVVG